LRSRPTLNSKIYPNEYTKLNLDQNYVSKNTK
jgi:hypothetical protein